VRHFLLVESNTTGTGALAVDRLLGRGDRVTFATRDPRRYPFLASQRERLSVARVETNHTPAITELLRDLSRTAPVDAVMSFSEFYVITVADLAAAHGLPGLDPAAARSCRDKHATRSRLRAAGMVQPDCRVLTSDQEVLDLSGRIQYPCVVKPPSDSSSHGVRSVCDPSELAAHCHEVLGWEHNVRGQRLGAGVLVESVLDGPEYSVETLTLANGSTRVIGVCRKHLGPPPHFVELGHDFPAPEPPDVIAALAREAERALGVLGFDFGPAHTELRLTRLGPVVVEVNPRLAGGMIPEIIRYATGIDLLDAWFALVAGEAPSVAPVIDGAACVRFLVAEESGRLVAVEGADRAWALPSTRDVTITSALDSQVRPARDAYDRLGYVLSAGTCTDRVAREASAAVALLRPRLQTLGEPVPS
jgi:cysteine synthase A